MSAADLIKRYDELGFQQVFWRRTGEDDGKGPREAGWTTKNYSVSAYADGMQNGVKTGTLLSSGKFLLDADLDWLPGCRFAGRFFPNAGFAFGRKSKPVGHLFFTTSAPIISKKFLDPTDNTTLIERRGTKEDGSIGLQTVLPPSMHYDSGEVVTFAIDNHIPHDDAVVDAITHYAVACLLGKHWPKNGPQTNQHDVAAHASGFLCRRGVKLDIVPVIIEVAATLGNDENVRDRVRFATETVGKFKNGDKKLSGGPKLSKELGEKVVNALREWLPSADPIAAAIDRLNEHFAIVSIGNKVVVMEMVADGSIKRLWSFDEFQRFLIKDRIEIETATAKGHEKTVECETSKLWLKSPNGRRYDQLVFAMPGSADACGPNDYNGWLGFTVADSPGDWSKNRSHWRNIICGGNDEAFAWVFNWVAALIQRPGRHAFSALVLRGGEGTGKGHFAHQTLGALFYKQQYLHIIGAEALTGRFNEHLSGKVLIFADESTWGGDPRAAEKLKGMVTESTVNIERKFLPLVEEPSALHIVIASNNEWPVSIPMDDRRYMVLDVSDRQRQNDAYFTPLRQELANGGLAALLHDLLAHPIDEYALRHPLSTSGKREVMAQSLKPIERWWYEKLVAGYFVDGEPWPEMVEKSAVHQDYLVFLDMLKDHRSRRSTETELGMFLKKYTECHQQQLIDVDTQRSRRVLELPSLEACRNQWARVCGWPKWSDSAEREPGEDDVPF